MERVSDDATEPPVSEEQWQEDRQVFDRDDVETAGDKAGQIYVTEAARKRWSDKNPRKFSPEIALKIVQYVGAGCFVETAAAAAGINKCTFYEWLKRAERSKPDKDGPEGTEELRAWKRQLDEAEANAEAQAVQGIMMAGATTWTAYAWFLERKYPHRWGRKETTIHENPDGSPITPPAIEVTFTKTPTERDATADVGAEPATD